MAANRRPRRARSRSANRQRGVGPSTTRAAYAVPATRRGDDAASLAPVAHQLGIEDVEQATTASEVKDQLRANFDCAIAVGVFGVPTLEVNGQLFWGADATPMFEQYLENPDLFYAEEMRRLDDLPVGTQRRTREG